MRQWKVRKTRTRFPFPYSDRFMLRLIFLFFWCFEYHHFSLFFQHQFISILEPFRTPSWSKNPLKIEPEADFFDVRSYIVRFSGFWRMYHTEFKVLRSRGLHKSSQNRFKIEKKRISKSIDFISNFGPTFLSIFSDFWLHLGTQFCSKIAQMGLQEAPIKVQ